MSDLKTLLTAANNCRAIWESANKAEIRARSDMFEAEREAGRVASVDARDQIGKEFTWQAYAHQPAEPCKIVDVRAHSIGGHGLVVNPAVVTRIAKGTQWGKTVRTLHRVVFNHDTREWEVRE